MAASSIALLTIDATRRENHPRLGAEPALFPGGVPYALWEIQTARRGCGLSAEEPVVAGVRLVLGLALGELEAAAGLGAAVLLTFNDAAVACQEAALLENGT